MHAVAVRPGAVDPQPVPAAAVAEVDRHPDAFGVLGAAPLGAGAERALYQGQVGLVDLDRRDDDGHRVRVGDQGAGGELLGVPVRWGRALQHGRRHRARRSARCGSWRRRRARRWCAPVRGAAGCSASVRVRPQDVTVASTGSRSASTTSPARRPASTRTPVPTGSDTTSTRPPVGAYPRSGSWASSRASRVHPSPCGSVGWQGAAQVGPQAHGEDAGAGAFLDPGVGGPAVGVDLGDGEGAVGVEGEVHHGAAAVAAPARAARPPPPPSPPAASSSTPVGGSSASTAQVSRRIGDLAQRRASTPCRVRRARRRPRAAAAPRGPSPPAARATPAAVATSASPEGVPRARMAAASGPRTSSPAPAQASASSARSAQGTSPSHTASARASSERGHDVGHGQHAVLGVGEHHGLGGLPCPPGRLARHGAHRDGAQPLAADRVGERAGGGEDPQSGFATVDDGEPSHTPHAGCPGAEGRLQAGAHVVRHPARQRHRGVPVEPHHDAALVVDDHGVDVPVVRLGVGHERPGGAVGVEQDSHPAAPQWAGPAGCRGRPPTAPPSGSTARRAAGPGRAGRRPASGRRAATRPAGRSARRRRARRTRRPGTPGRGSRSGTPARRRPPARGPRGPGCCAPRRRRRRVSRTRPVKCVVRTGSSEPGSRRSRGEGAVGDEVGPSGGVGCRHGRDGERARLVTVELHRGQEGHVLDVTDPVARRGDQPGDLGEGLHPHDTRQDGGAVDPVVGEEAPGPPGRASPG